ncbi:MAG: hypothetical protein R2765_08400 [Ferruginibacter sp.]
MATHTVKTVFNENMSFTSTINGHNVRMDTTPDDEVTIAAQAPND